MGLKILSYDERVFKDRREAGKLLADALEGFRGQDILVLAIPRGGAVIGREIAERLDADLDILLSRKLGAPDAPELAIGAVTEDGTVFLNETIIEELNIPREYIDEETRNQMEEIRRRQEVFRAVRQRAPVKGRTVIVTDDGAATGATLQAALQYCRRGGPRNLVCAFPAGSDDAVTRLAHNADSLVTLSVPPVFSAVSQAYADFPQVTDEEVLEILRERRTHEKNQAPTGQTGTGGHTV